MKTFLFVSSALLSPSSIGVAAVLEGSDQCSEAHGGTCIAEAQQQQVSYGPAMLQLRKIGHSKEMLQPARKQLAKEDKEIAFGTCKASCTAQGFCCDRVSGCGRPSCTIGCDMGSHATDLDTCTSWCKAATGTCRAFPESITLCVRQEATCADCEAACGAGISCEPEGGCEQGCLNFFASSGNPNGSSHLQVDNKEELERCPQFGNESKMAYFSDEIFTFWWDRNFDSLSAAQEAAKVFRETRAEALANGMPDPPNPASGYYFNVYMHRGEEDHFPQWGAGVGTNQKGLPFMTLGTGIAHGLWRHEGFHVFQYASKGIPYSGDTMWATEAVASWFALTQDHSSRTDFENNLAVSNNPHLALWHSFTNGPSEEVGIWDYGVRQYGIHSMLWYISTSNDGKTPAVDRSFIYAAFTSPTPVTGGLQQYLSDHGGQRYMQGFLEWAAHTTNDHDYLTADQIDYAQWNVNAHGAGPSAQHPYAVTVGHRTDEKYSVKPADALKPRGWGYNVVLMTDLVPGTYSLRLVGDATGSEGATAHFVACALVGSGASANIISFEMEKNGLQGSATVLDHVSGGPIKLIILAAPIHFTGNQNYGYRIDVQRLPTSCRCDCHDDRYAPDDRNEPPNDCWIPDVGYDKPCCTPATTTITTTTSPPLLPCLCDCHGDHFAPDDRNEPPNDCWIPGVGHDTPCCTPATTITTTSPPLPSCLCDCHGDPFAPDDRNDPPNDCWIPDVGYDRPCC